MIWVRQHQSKSGQKHSTQYTDIQDNGTKPRHSFMEPNQRHRFKLFCGCDPLFYCNETPLSACLFTDLRPATCMSHQRTDHATHMSNHRTEKRYPCNSPCYPHATPQNWETGMSPYATHVSHTRGNHPLQKGPGKSSWVPRLWSFCSSADFLSSGTTVPEPTHRQTWDMKQNTENLLAHWRLYGW